MRLRCPLEGTQAYELRLSPFYRRNTNPPPPPIPPYQPCRSSIADRPVPQTPLCRCTSNSKVSYMDQNCRIHRFCPQHQEPAIVLEQAANCQVTAVNDGYLPFPLARKRLFALASIYGIDESLGQATIQRFKPSLTMCVSG